MSFKDIYGQDRQIAVLQRTVACGRLPHAYLFYGVKGVGKKTTAVTLAKTLNCKNNGTDSCDICTACSKIDHGNHPDIFLIRPEGIFIKIEEIRALQNQAKYRPFEGKKRVFIIEDAERLNIPAANALLKTLEEPGPSNILILTTSRPYLMLPTIISRCQKIRFSPVRKDTIVAFLMERYMLEKEVSLILAASSGGSIGKVLEIMDESYIALKRNLIEKITSYNGERDSMQLLLLTRELGGDRNAVLEKMNILKSWYRDVLVFKEMKNRADLIHPDCAERTEKFSERMTGPNILKSMKIVECALSVIEKNANKQLTLESMMFKLAAVRENPL
jgi:DNA polymerase-3 subunit delta'